MVARLEQCPIKHGRCRQDTPRAQVEATPAAVPARARRPTPWCRPEAEGPPGGGASPPAHGAGVTVPGARAFRLCHYAILNDHLHFLVEGRDREALARGIQGLLVRIARALNKLWGRQGKVFADRYHDRILKSPREVRNAIRYVLGNGSKHAAAGREVAVPQAIDTYTSAPWFDGFRETIVVRGLEAIVRPVADARTWMLTIGWRRHGLLSVHELPAAG